MAATIRSSVKSICAKFLRQSLLPGNAHLPSHGSATTSFSAADGWMRSFSTGNFPGRGSTGTSARRRKTREKTPASRQVLRMLLQADERETVPKVALNFVQVTVGGNWDPRERIIKPGNINPDSKKVNTANTRVHLRLNLKNAGWLSERIKERIMLLEKDRISRNGELVVSSSKTRKQDNNYEEVAGKLRKMLGKLQAIIDTASYVPKSVPTESIQKINEFKRKCREEN